MNNLSIREYINVLRTSMPDEDYRNISNNKLFEILRDRGILIEKDGLKNVPNNQMYKNGLFDGEKKYYEAENKWSFKPLITKEGCIWLTKNLYKAGYIKTKVDFLEAYNRWNNSWELCDIKFLLNHLLDSDKYIFQYNKNTGNEWYSISVGAKIETLFNIKNKNYKIRYIVK